MKEKKEQIFSLEREICDHCLGRQFKEQFEKTDTASIGAAVRKGKNEKEVQKIIKQNPKIYETDKCFVCQGLFLKINDIIDLILGKMNDYQFETFLVGTVVPKRIIENEETLWEKTGVIGVEPLKRELNRILRDKLVEKCGKKIDFEYPDIIFLADFLKQRTMVQLNSIFIEGKYNKLKRGIPQTKWPCMSCWGKGCQECKGTGRQYPETLEELVAEPFLEATQATKEKFHGQGREDLDALMLGDGRPFVLEIEDPKIRKLDLKKIEKELNKKQKGKIKIHDLKFVMKGKIKEIKSRTFDKTYRCSIECKKKIKKDNLKSLESFFKNKQILQKTPERVLKHRADKERKRIIKSLKVKQIDDKHFEIEVQAEAGTYIKELINGDKERTKPSITKELKNECKCIELDVLKIHEVKND